MTGRVFAFYRAISGSAERFRGLLPRGQETQRQRLLTLLRRNAGTEFGRRHGFASIRDAADYRARVPVSTYEDLRPPIERMARGEGGVLVADPVLAWQQTGGSTGGAKAVPYTAAALAAFRRAVLPWLDDLATVYPRITTGRAYWSISPAGGESDAAYFGAELAPLVLETLAVPPEIGALADIDEWREATRARLAACGDLVLISIWSPTFLSGLVDPGAAWPQLQVISCWDQGSSRPHAEALRARFPGVRVQGKGLLATEGVVTIPLEEFAMPVLAVDSGFFEFRDDAGQSFLGGEVTVGDEYEVVLTTEGGLYRYATGDRVRVHGFAGEAPLLEFLGRGAQVSDLCGEKLTEDFVLGALEPLGLCFAMVTPAAEGYVLVLDAAEVSPERARALAARADAGLCRNPQYAYARRLKQLRELEVVRRERPLEAWLRAGLARGQRLGDIKPPALCTEQGWAR